MGANQREPLAGPPGRGTLADVSYAARGPGRWYAVLGLGALVAMLGTYAQVHDPTGQPLATFGFSGMINMKVWFTAVAMLLAGQVLMTLRLYGRIGSGRAPSWVVPLHRGLDHAAIVVSAPVAFHCLWTLGFSSFDLRTTLHSVAGCLV